MLSEELLVQKKKCKISTIKIIRIMLKTKKRVWKDFLEFSISGFGEIALCRK